MCLRTITQKESLVTEDTPIWKVVKKCYDGNTLDSSYYEFGIWNYQPHKVKRGINKARVSTISSYINGEYDSGYHCFICKEDTNFYRNCHFNKYTYSILKFWIPKGTKITIGVDASMFETIVSPILLRK